MQPGTDISQTKQQQIRDPLSLQQTDRMLCPSIFQATPAAMRPFLELHWPIRSLWPETRPLFFQMEQEMIRHMQEMRQSMEYMERLHQKIFEEIDQTSCSAGALRPIAFQELGKDSDKFALSLDTAEFAPQELSVKQVGRKLRDSMFYRDTKWSSTHRWRTLVFYGDTKRSFIHRLRTLVFYGDAMTRPVFQGPSMTPCDYETTF
ncbi:heat shock protein beta-11-like isoform X2 [Xiphophorus hellerii]|uniref:heat shock protein beta-11-like isoform X2 n=1 Tax=Xiphophorus hellerii TaxID=8084 RepID=UPI0013B447FA|nr:heat shock protein beta-11-like isoform X2 [Xiphophorus hellerii]